MLTSDQIHIWDTTGYIHLPSFYRAGKTMKLKGWAKELASLPEQTGKWMFYYEQSLRDAGKLPCRIENFLPYHKGFKELLTDYRLKSTLRQLTGEGVCLFKEKINFKYSGANGFSPHQDAPAFAIFQQHYHVTVMTCIDNCTQENGCIEFAPGRHREGLFPQAPNGDLASDVVEKMDWTPVPSSEGDVIIFDSYIPHRSGPNLTDKPRRALFATYNRISDRERRDEYFDAKRKYFPPENERIAGKDYSSANPFNLGNPIK